MPSPIFVVDSSPAVRRMVEQISIPEGFEVVGFQDGPAALEAARQSTPSLIIADYHLDNMTFSGFCKEINKLENLTETSLISLINSADHPDENHLRTLGVKVFLKKPFQSEDLLEVLKSLGKTPSGSSTGKGLKRRVWPPTSTSTDTDSDESGDTVASREGQEEAQSQAGRAAIIPPASSAGPEDAMKGLFDQLLQSMTKRSEQRLADLLPKVIDAKLSTHVRPIVEKELQEQLGNILSQEYLTSLMQPLLAQTVPSLIKKELASCEPIIRQAVADLANPTIGENVDRLVREQVESGVHQYLPAVVREQVGTIDQMVKDELHQAVSQHVPILADDLVRACARESVEQAVLRIVPDVAEQHIKAELKRLIETEEAPRPSKG
ncbi:MAG: response regulator [Nitrospira sp.]|nr:response regulator [Nitrospira sp.]MDH4368843.1 response regulator [Nitrospira sp.]MDH5347947.1 response regulator [Nitrospira sp.]MDH5496212.1 response regulator [Nitrospira sp.]MDH5724107.1 response regulator [Nitrospira sp.]